MWSSSATTIATACGGSSSSSCATVTPSSTPRSRWRARATTTRSCRSRPNRRLIRPRESRAGGPRLTSIDLHPVPEVRSPRLGWPRCADRDDQARVRRRGALDFGGVLPQAARRLPGAARARGARVVRLFRSRAGGQAGRLPGGTGIHAAWIPADARPVGAVRRGESGRSSRGAFLRAVRGRRRADREGADPARRVVSDRCDARGHRRRGVLPDAVRFVQLRPRAPWGGARLRAVDQRTEVGGPGALGDSRGATGRGRDGHLLTDHADIPGGSEGGAADVRRRLHGDTVPAGERGRNSSLADERAVRRRPGPFGRPAGAPDHLLDLRGLCRGRSWRRARDDAGNLPARVRLPDLPASPPRRGRRERAPTSLPTRGGRRGRGADRRGDSADRRYERGGRLHGGPRCGRVLPTASLPRQAHGSLRGRGLWRDRRAASANRRLVAGAEPAVSPGMARPWPRIGSPSPLRRSGTTTEQNGIDLDAHAALAFVAKASALIARSLDYDRTLGEVARLAVPELADWCAVDVLAPDGSLRQVTSTHPDPELEELLLDLRRLYRSEKRGSEGVARVIATGEPELMRDVTDQTRLGIPAEARDLYSRLAPRSYMIVPLIARGRTIGAVTFLSTREGRHYGDGALRFAQDLAHRLALAVDNARLYEEASAARDRLAFLSHASEVLARSLDLDRTLDELARLAVPRLGDWCSIELVDETGEIRNAATAHVDPEKVELAAHLRTRYPIDPDDPTGVANVVKTGRPELFREIPDRLLAG